MVQTHMINSTMDNIILDNVIYINLVDVDESSLEGFPHIATEITRLWRTTKFIEYYHSLVIRDRADRQGFSDEVLEELSFLYQVCMNNFMLMNRENNEHYNLSNA